MIEEQIVIDILVSKGFYAISFVFILLPSHELTWKEKR